MRIKEYIVKIETSWFMKLIKIILALCSFLILLKLLTTYILKVNNMNYVLISIDIITIIILIIILIKIQHNTKKRKEIKSMNLLFEKYYFDNIMRGDYSYSFYVVFNNLVKNSGDKKNEIMESLEIVRNSYYSFKNILKSDIYSIEELKESFSSIICGLEIISLRTVKYKDEWDIKCITGLKELVAKYDDFIVEFKREYGDRFR